MSRRVALAFVAASTVALAGCGGVVGARMTFDDTERAKVTDIVLSGGSGDVSVTSGTGTETRVKRVLRGATEPGPSYQLAGSVLTLPTECGNNCHVSYEITAPAGVTVRGDLRSGDVFLKGTGPVDLKMTSGDVMVENTTGPVAIKATSGDLTVIGAPSVTLEVTSGDIMATDIAGPVDARATSGDLTVDLTKPASVRATVTSGDLNLTVPDGAYRISTETSSGDEMLDGLATDPKATNALDLRTRNGDLTVMRR